MPMIEIHMLEGRSDAIKRSLLDAVHRAVLETLDVTPDKIRIWLQEMKPTEYMVAGRLASERDSGEIPRKS